MDLWTALVIVALAAGVALLVYGWFVEPTRATRRRHTLPLVNLPPGLDGLTILHISDLHLRRGDERRAALIRQASDGEPDLIAITGDFIETDEDAEYCARTLDGLRARYGVFAVLGNHDHAGDATLLQSLTKLRRHQNDVSRLVALLERVGIRVLNNEHVPVRIDGQVIWVVGVDDPYTNFHDLGRALQDVPAEGFRLLLAHSPDVRDQLGEPGRHVDLILSGHTHGGQVRLPLIGALMTRTRLPLRPAAGWLRAGEAWMHVSRGLGGSIPVRFLCPPESTLIELKALPRPAGRQPLPSEVNRTAEV